MALDRKNRTCKGASMLSLPIHSKPAELFDGCEIHFSSDDFLCLLTHQVPLGVT